MADFAGQVQPNVINGREMPKEPQKRPDYPFALAAPSFRFLDWNFQVFSNLFNRYGFQE
jgi:hypothetical protein